jgi:hypothetical protein
MNRNKRTSHGNIEGQETNKWNRLRTKDAEYKKILIMVYQLKKIFLNSQKINQKKRIYSNLKCKGPKNFYGATRRNLQAQPKILKKLSEH